MRFPRSRGADQPEDLAARHLRARRSSRWRRAPIDTLERIDFEQRHAAPSSLAPTPPQSVAEEIQTQHEQQHGAAREQCERGR